MIKKIIISLGFLIVNTHAQSILPGNVKVINSQSQLPSNIKIIDNQNVATDIYGNPQTVINATPDVSIITDKPVGDIVNNVKQDFIDYTKKVETPVIDANNKIILPDTANLDKKELPVVNAKKKVTPVRIGQIEINNKVLKDNDIGLWNNSTLEEIEIKAKKDLELKYSNFINNIDNE